MPRKYYDKKKHVGRQPNPTSAGELVANPDYLCDYWRWHRRLKGIVTELYGTTYKNGQHAGLDLFNDTEEARESRKRRRGDPIMLVMLKELGNQYCACDDDSEKNDLIKRMIPLAKEVDLYVERHYSSVPKIYLDIKKQLTHEAEVAAKSLQMEGLTDEAIEAELANDPALMKLLESSVSDG